jgi:hypothetical protein
VRGVASTRSPLHIIPISANGPVQHSPAQSNPVGMLALTKKSRSGILALISTSSGERVDARALPDGVRPLSPTGHQAVRGAGEPPAHVGTAPKADANSSRWYLSRVR